MHRLQRVIVVIQNSKPQDATVRIRLYLDRMSIQLSCITGQTTIAFATSLYVQKAVGVLQL